MSERVDVAIVGGGPAGAAAALTLARAGVATVVFERAPMPRDKVCGDLLGTEAIASLRRIGFSARALADAYPITGAVLHGTNGATYGASESTDRAPHASDARAVARLHFDAALLAESHAAGAVVRYERVLEVVAHDASAAPEIQLRTERSTTRARVVIGADGWGSLVSRALANPAAPAANVAVAARAYALGVRGLARRMHFFVNPPGDGYGWIFPLGDDRANVGLGFIRSEGHVDLARAFERFRGPSSPAWPYLCDATFDGIAAWPIALGPRALRVAARGIFLTGDAASLASPLSGSGIHHALASGEAAARFALRALAGDSRAERRYTRWLARRIGVRLGAERFAHRAFATAATVDRYAPLARIFGAGDLISRGLLALG